ncbi:MAG TPA: tetratricopeptide repeat protein [Methylomirabilota bacterium]|nr:tetratricopeptide repeat protein [Methylomirabilota bacterium]
MTRRLALAVAAILALAGTAPAQERRPIGDSPAALVERGRAAFAEGRYAEALDAARAAASAAPRSLPAQLMRGAMAEFIGEFDEAQRAYSQALALAPHDLTARYRTAVLSVRVGEYDRALRELDTILATQPRTAQFVFRWAPPIVQTRLLRDNPALEQLVQTQIDILMEKGDLAEARRLSRRHAVVESGHDYCADANARKKSNAGSDAVFHAFRLAALGQPDAADCIWWYGQWLTDEGYMRLGRLMVEEGTRLTPSQANRDSGARYVRIRLGGARPVPKRAESLFLIAKQRYFRDGDVEGASRLFDECVRLAPGFARPYAYKARMAWDAGERDAAATLLRRGVEADPESWRTWHNLGRALLAVERWEDAEHALTKAVELFPDDVGGRLGLARALYAQGKYDAYTKETKRAVGFARVFRNSPTALPEPGGFLEKFERWGPGAGLPPAPDPHLILGWNQD